MTQLRCVLFDHDDTLLPTFALRARVLADAALDVLEREIDGEAFLLDSHGKTLEQMSNDLAAGDDALAASLVTAYRRRYYVANREGLVPFEGIEALLATLRARDLRVGVVTSKLSKGARDELARTGLSAHIEHLTGADEVRETKPAAEPLLRAMHALDIEPAQTLMVGDTAADILGARAAGTMSAAALWGATDRDVLLALSPDYALEHPRDVLRVI